MTLVQRIAVLTFWVFAARAVAEDHYYLALVTNQGDAREQRPVALLIKTGPGQEDGTCQINTKTIALPNSSLRIGARERMPMAKTLADVAVPCGPAPVRMWGPYAVKKSFYDMMLSQENSLDRRAASVRDRGEGTADYFAALDALNENAKRWQASGEANRLLVLRGLQPWLLPRDKAPDWLSERLQIRKDR
jgi:hypothetical protein